MSHPFRLTLACPMDEFNSTRDLLAFLYGKDSMNDLLSTPLNDLGDHTTASHVGGVMRMPSMKAVEELQRHVAARRLQGLRWWLTDAETDELVATEETIELLASFGGGTIRNQARDFRHLETSTAGGLGESASTGDGSGAWDGMNRMRPYDAWRSMGLVPAGQVPGGGVEAPSVDADPWADLGNAPLQGYTNRYTDDSTLDRSGSTTRTWEDRLPR